MMDYENAAHGVIAYMQRRGFPKDESVFAEITDTLGWKVTLASQARVHYPKLPQPDFYHDGALLMRYYHPHTRQEIGASVVYTFTEAGTVPFTGQKRTRARYCERGGNYIYFSKRLDWNNIPPGTVIYICESVIKAEILCRLGYYAIGLNGIRGYGDGAGGMHWMFSLLPWKELGLRACVLFDSISPTNAANKRDLREATKSVAEFLAGMYEIQVSEVVLPMPDAPEWANDKGCWGIDDLHECRGEVGVLAVLAEEVEIDVRVSSAQYQCTDLANAYRLRKALGGDICFCPAWGWLVWNGKVWEPNDAEIARQAQQLSRLISLEMAEHSARAAQSTDTTERDRLIAFVRQLGGWAVKCESKSVIENAIGLLKPIVTVSIKLFEQHPWYFNCENGVVDLHTGNLLPHSRDDYLMNYVPVKFKPSARSALWETTLQQIFAGDEELIRYKQRTLGYAMTGVVYDEVLFIDAGSGGNGKGVINDTFMLVMGAYAAPGPKVLLEKGSKGTDLKNEYAFLYGKRYIAVSETENRCHLNAGATKEITGNGKITGRFLYKDYFTFDMTHKMQLITNHKPTVDAQDDGVWRRLKLLEYPAKFADGLDLVGNTKLRDELKTEANLEGVLAWAVAGCLAWQARGLDVPQRVKAATREYRKQEDIIEQFLEARCIRGPGHKVKRAALHQVYRMWCQQEEYRPLSSKRFIPAIDSKLGEAWKDSNGDYHWQGAKIQEAMKVKYGG